LFEGKSVASLVFVGRLLLYNRFFFFDLTFFLAKVKTS
jgi:hypothetical protein